MIDEKMNQEKPYDLILFDLDGTLVDSRQDIADGLNRMLEDFNLFPIDPRIISAFIGRGVSPLIGKTMEYSRKRYGGPDGLPELKEAMNLFREHYKAVLLNHTRCYPFVEQTLQKMEGLHKAIVTNKPSEFTIPILEGLGLDQYFSFKVCGDTKIKPDPAMIFQCLEKFAVSPQRTLMIGDSHMDLEMGLRAGVHTGFVCYGFGSVKDYRPDYMMEGFLDLLGIVFPKKKLQRD